MSGFIAGVILTIVIGAVIYWAKKNPDQAKAYEDEIATEAKKAEQQIAAKLKRKG